MASVGPVPKIDARFSAPGAVASPWDDVRRAIAEAELFWISTVRADGRPHVTPLLAVWHHDTLHFCTGAAEQKGMNLIANPNCALTTGSNAWNRGVDLVIEGTAQRVTDGSRLQTLAGEWESKYGDDWHFDVANGAFQGDGGEALVYAVVMTKVLAFAKDEFAQTSYRF